MQMGERLGYDCPAVLPATVETVERHCVVAEGEVRRWLHMNVGAKGVG